MVHLAWLHATPEKRKTSRFDDLKAKESKGEAVPELEPPPVPYSLQHLVAHLFEVGPGTAGEKLTSTEIRHWQEGTGEELNSFQFSALLQMSSAYMGMRYKAMKPDCKLPRYDEETHEEKQDRRAAVNDKLHAMAAKYAAAPDGPKRMIRRK